MSIAIGILLGIGLLLVASPLLWPAGRRPAGPSRLGRGIRDRLVQAGLGGVHPGVLVVACVLTGGVAGAIAAAVLPVLVVAIVAALVGAALPVVAIAARARMRRRRTRVVWPDVVEHLLSAVRAGLPLPEALSALAESGPEPTRAAFAGVARDLAATGDLGVALDDLKDRLADPVADRIIETLRMAREVGGTELPTVLRSLAAYLRRDAALRAEVESRQSWTKNAARLGVAAPWVVLLLLCTRPEAVRAYDSAAGAALLIAGFVVSVVAYRVMAAIGRLPEERRWFA